MIIMEGIKMVNFSFVLSKGFRPKTLYKSFTAYRQANRGPNCQPLRAFQIDGKTKLTIQKSAQIINKGYISMGLDPKDFYPSTKPCTLELRENSKLLVGTAFIGRGVTIQVQKNASLEMGTKVYINSNVTIICSNNIKIGDDTAIGWETEICDTDYHRAGKDSVITAPIEIGSHVLIGRHAMIMKGVKIGDGSVVAAGSIVTRDVPSKCLVAGIPARVIKQNVEWEI